MDALEQAESGFEELRSLPTRHWVEVCRRAAGLFREAELDRESPELYLQRLAQSSGMPHRLGSFNLDKLAYILENQESILAGLTRNLDWQILDQGLGQQGGLWLSFYPTTRALALILPSNSPGVNGLWQVCLPLRIPVVLKPGPLDPWTPRRLVAALRAAGAPPAAHTLVDYDHSQNLELVQRARRSVVFGHSRTTALFPTCAGVQKHGTGHSKIVLDERSAADWPKYLDLMVESVLSNSGRSCINASAIYTPSHGREIARALAERLAPVQPLPLDHPEAQLGAFPVAETALQMDQDIQSRLEGAWQATPGPRLEVLDGLTFLRPCVVYCPAPDHPLADQEYHFPFVSVVEVAQSEMVGRLGKPLVVSALTEDARLRQQLLQAPIGRLNLGPIPTHRVAWNQPHAGNLFDFLYERRALQLA